MASRVVAGLAAVVTLVSGCSSTANGESMSSASATSAESLTQSSTSTEASTTTTTDAPPVAFEATAEEVEARIELFGEAIGEVISTFAPIQGSEVVGAEVNSGSAVGYLLGAEDAVLATAVFVPLEAGQTTFSTPARLLSVVVTSGLNADEMDAGAEIFRRELLDELASIGGTTMTYESGLPFYQVTASVKADGVLFVAQPPGGSRPPLNELATRLSTLATSRQGT